MDVFRTPDERFDGLPDSTSSRTTARSTACGSLTSTSARATPVVFFHGEPTWSYLWRKVIAAGARRGLSLHRARLRGLRALRQAHRHRLVLLRPPRRARRRRCSSDLDLRNATAVVHDWGGPIGLRMAVEHPDRIARMVIMDTGLFTGEQQMSRRVEDLPRLRRAHRGPADLDAGPQRLRPRHGRRGRRCVRRAVPGARGEGRRACVPADAADARPTCPAPRPASACSRRCATTTRPKLHLWADSDPIIPFKVGERFAAAINAEPPEKIDNASHFLQEDAGAEIGARIADWLRA